MFMVGIIKSSHAVTFSHLIATKNYIAQAQFALDVKRKVLPIYEQLFDVEYPLPKLDTLIVSISSIREILTYKSKIGK